MKDRAELLVRQEFDKAVQALADGNLPLAAFYSGALAHYMGGLGQFHHIMGSQSHWGSEDQKRHSAYEVAVESTIRFQTRTSIVFESFISPIAVGGDSPGRLRERLPYGQREAAAPMVALPASWTRVSVN